MDNIGQFLEDKRFIDWVFHPDEEIERYWESYLLARPSAGRLSILPNWPNGAKWN